MAPYPGVEYKQKGEPEYEEINQERTANSIILSEAFKRRCTGLLYSLTHRCQSDYYRSCAGEYLPVQNRTGPYLRISHAPRIVQEIHCIQRNIQTDDLDHSFLYGSRNGDTFSHWPIRIHRRIIHLLFPWSSDSCHHRRNYYEIRVRKTNISCLKAKEK